MPSLISVSFELGVVIVEKDPFKEGRAETVGEYLY